MSRALIVVGGDRDRQRAIHWASRAPLGTRIEFKAAQRTLDQNSRMWAMLTDIATQVVWHGVKLAADDWKLVFLDALRREIGSELRLVPNLDQTGFVNVGTSSSDLSKDEMTGLIDLMFKFGAEHKVQFQDESVAA
jgi:hypothetical protein